MSRFDHLISPTEAVRFFRTHWERSHLRLHRGQPEYYADILTAADIDTLFRSGRLPAAQIKAVQENANRTPQQSGEGFADMAELLKQYAQGATLVIDGAHQMIPPLNLFCAGLEAELQFPVQANIYITPPQARGLRPHFDTHDVIVMQIAGQKEWHLYGFTAQAHPTAEDAHCNRTDVEREAEESLTLHAGDLLYLPRGLIHDAVTGAGPSIHVALGLKPDLRLDLLRALAERAQRRAFFRQALPTGLSDADEAAALGPALKRELLALVEELDVEDLLAERRRAFVGGQLAEREGLFLDLLDPARLTPETVLRRRSTVSVDVAREGDRIVARFGAQEVSVPRFMEAALRVIVSGTPFAPRDLPGLLDDEGRMVLTRQFLQTGLLRIQDDPAA